MKRTGLNMMKSLMLYRIQNTMKEMTVELDSSTLTLRHMEEIQYLHIIKSFGGIS